MSDAIPTTREFTPDFSNTTHYTPEYGFDSVIFPTGSPLLAQDLNESQAILNEVQRSVLSTLLSNGVIDTGVNWFSGRDVSIPDGKVLWVSINGRILPIKGPVSLSGVDNWVKCRFRKTVIGADYGDIDGMENYLADNELGMELSRRTKYIFEGLFDTFNLDPDEECLDLTLINDSGPVYAKIKVASNQGDELNHSLNRDIRLLFNEFCATSYTEQVLPDGVEVITEEQRDFMGDLIATKLTRYYSDDEIEESLEIPGHNVIYYKITTFSVDENGNEIIDVVCYAE